VPLPIHLALVSKTPAVAFGEVAIVSAAIQRQLIRDFNPIWDIDATIDAFERPEDIPLGYWPIRIVDTFDDGGQHRVGLDDQPFALVAAGTSWSLAASHEALEMLANPFGTWKVPGDSSMANQGRVEFLVEVCDPCQSDEFAYTVNGVLVSDFYTREYFAPMRADGVRYSFRGAITQPREVLPGGYLSWRDPLTNDWFQEQRFTGPSTFKRIGPLPEGTTNLRRAIDQRTPETRRLAGLPPDRPAMQRAAAKQAASRAAAYAQAQRQDRRFDPRE